MENNSTTKKPHLQFGIIFGLMMILGFLLIYLLGVDVVENPTMAKLISVFNYFIFPVIFITLGCINFKKLNNGFISMPESLKTGVSIVFVGTLIFVVFNSLFNFMFPEYLELVLSQTKRILVKENPSMTDEQVQMAVDMTRKFSSPMIAIPLSLLIFSFLGLIYSAIIGLIVKKDNPQSI